MDISGRPGKSGRLVKINYLYLVNKVGQYRVLNYETGEKLGEYIIEK